MHKLRELVPIIVLLNVSVVSSPTSHFFITKETCIELSKCVLTR